MPLASFCPSCGGEIRPTEPGGGVCVDCKKPIWANAKPTAGAIIERDGKLLLIRRGVEPGLGKWDIPGGHLDEEEDPEAGARREVREEVGLELGEMRLTQADVNVLPTHTVVDILFETSESSGEPRTGSDAAGFGWFDPDDLPDDLAFDTTRRIFDRWKRQRRGDDFRLVGGTRIEIPASGGFAGFRAPLASIPAGWSVECGEWGVHDGALCARMEGERPAVLWLDQAIEGDHLVRFRGWTAAGGRGDINCFWDGSGSIEGADGTCTIGSVGGWWEGLSGIERHPEGGVRATTRLRPLEPGRAYDIVAGRLGTSDFLFVDGRLAAELSDPRHPRRASSKVALATWNSHVHFDRALVLRLPPPA